MKDNEEDLEEELDDTNSTLPQYEQATPLGQVPVPSRKQNRVPKSKKRVALKHPDSNLTIQQEMFCRYYTSPSEFYGNGTQSYGAAYGFDLSNPISYSSARSAASRLLADVIIVRRISDLLDESGFNELNADKQLAFLMLQGVDFRSKLGAIREFNKLKGRVTEKLQLELPVAKINIRAAKPRPIEPPKQIDTYDSSASDSE